MTLEHRLRQLEQGIGNLGSIGEGPGRAELQTKVAKLEAELAELRGQGAQDAQASPGQPSAAEVTQQTVEAARSQVAPQELPPVPSGVISQEEHSKLVQQGLADEVYMMKVNDALVSGELRIAGQTDADALAVRQANSFGGRDRLLATTQGNEASRVMQADGKLEIITHDHAT